MMYFPISRRSVWHCGVVLGLAAGFVALSGCDKDDNNDTAAPGVVVAPQPRPDELTQAISDVKDGKAEQAQARVEEFLKANPKSLYVPEAHYLLGQSLVAQKNYAEGKKQLDRAVDDAPDRTLKALAMLGRADCNMELKQYHTASRQYHWLETMYRDVKAVPQDELMYKLGMATKLADCPDTANYWFNQVIELYATSPYAELARKENTVFTPVDDKTPRVYTLEVSSWSTREKADSEAQILRDKGYRDVEVIEATQNGIAAFEIHLGKFSNRNDAIRAQTDAELAGLSTSLRPGLVEPLK